MIESTDLKGQTGITHGFFTRDGGVSSGIYAGLNCGFGSDDVRADVAENRRRVAEKLGAPTLLTAYQIHSPDVVTVTTPWTPQTAPKADAMATNVPGIALGILTADCAPILLADAQAGVIGAAHAGWKGALLGVGTSVVDAMVALGAQKSRIHAAIGPCLALENFEVGPEFVDSFLEKDPSFDVFFSQKAEWPKPHFDLLAFVVQRLRDTGIDHIDPIAVDTYADTESFFSYRRTCHAQEPDYGRQIAAISLSNA